MATDELSTSPSTNTARYLPSALKELQLEEHGARALTRWLVELALRWPERSRATCRSPYETR
jgi:hypothetical protein